MRVLSWVFLLLAASLASASLPYGAIVVDAASGKALYRKGADVPTQPASLTKMMTLLLTFRENATGRLPWGRKLRVSAHAARQAPSSLGLYPGKTVTVRQAVLATITKSANDAAVVLAENIAGSESAFVVRMNQEARRLGMKSTVFCNASGLPNKRQVSTAQDMAQLSRELIRRYPKYYPLFATKSFTYDRHSYVNHNKLLGRARGGVVVDGLKTGFVNASGFNLAASAVKGKRRLIVVVLGGPNRLWRDARVSHLFQYGFEGRAAHPLLAVHRPPQKGRTRQELEEDDVIGDLIRSLNFEPEVAPPPKNAKKRSSVRHVSQS
ncbi:MAG: D-alanyl-D-alanine carboxypeptidase [Holosporales bacterium]|jgi:D-alanyl-D-alanine carboxypeptidase|nr:D-alanyl-D-alanine carboxypeptidase [Holosporales bacterium]